MGISMGDAKSRWGDAKCQWGDANSWWETRFPASPQQFKYWVAPPLNQAALKKKKIMQYAIQIVENNQAIVPNMKKSTLMLQKLSMSMIIVHLYWLENFLYA